VGLSQTVEPGRENHDLPKLLSTWKKLTDCAAMSIVDLGKIVAQGNSFRAKGRNRRRCNQPDIENTNGKDSNGLKEESKKILSGLRGVTDIVNSDMGVTVCKEWSLSNPDIVRASTKRRSESHP